MRLLAIDDNADNLTSLRAVLADCLPGVHVLTATSGQRGLELARAQDPDVILLDIIMPEMDGYSVCRKLKEDELTRQTPVLFLTSMQADRGSRVQALDAGAEGFLSKPFDETELVAQIRAMTKVKAANRIQRLEREQLVAIVAERTAELERELAERKRLEQAIRIEANRNRVLFEQSPDGIVIVDPETTRFVQFNTAAHRQLGYSRDEFAQLCLFDVDAQETAADTRGRVAGVLQHGSADFETQQRARDGGIRHVHVTAQVVTIDEQSIYYCVWRDITARKQVEARIRQQAALLEASHDAILVWHAGEGVQFMNPAAETLSGQKYCQARSQPLGQVLRTRSPLDLQAAIREVSARGSWTGELTLLTSEGSPRHVASRWTALGDDSAGSKPILITCNDITEQKRLESQYLRAQRLESIGTLASGVAHDLNNILSPILMGTELLDVPDVDPQTHDVLAVIRQSAERGRDIVGQLLTFARGGPSQKGPVQPRHVLKEIGNLVRETFPKNIQIYVDYSGEPATVLADPSQLHQVLMNLCVNARDAMPEGGVLFVNLENRTLDEKAARVHPKARPIPYVVFRVADNGLGIPPEMLEHIFDPFFTTKPAGKGTGLGLATVLGIAENHDGFVTVESQVGQGTTFEVYLPASVAQLDPGTARRPAAAPRGREELVLIVDDEPAIVRLAETILRNQGYQTLAATSAAGALEHLDRQAGEIQIVLTDMMMPFTDGSQLIAAIRGSGCQVPIVAMSGVATEQFQQETIAQGVSGFLRKPFSAEQLFAAVGAALASGNLAPSSGTRPATGTPEET